MKGYWLILASQVTDEAAQQAYVERWGPIAEKYRARIRVLDPHKALRESGDYARALVVEFESHAQALACYHDPLYQAAKEYALKAARRELLILCGEPPQG